MYLFLIPLILCSKEHLRAWLADPQGRDQYVTYRGEDVEIYWHGKPSQCELAYKPVRTSNSLFFLAATNNDLGLERFPICCLVTLRYLRLYSPSTRRTIMGRPILETSAAFRSPTCEAHRLFTVRAIHCYLVK